MKLDGATIPIEKRTLDLNIDMAAAFYRVHLKQILTLVLAFAVPSTGLAYCLAHVTRDGFILGLTLFYFASPVLGSVLVAGIGPRVFGETFEVRRAFSFFYRRSAPLCWALWWPRLLLAFGGLLFYPAGTAMFLFYLVLPAVFLGRSCMVAEVMLLEQLTGSRLRKRMKSIRQGVVFDLVLKRWLGALFFFVLVVVIGFVVVDRSLEILVGFKVFLGRLDSIFDSLMPRFIAQPWPVALLQMLLWLVYPLSRMALFFCYLDVRIRKECWDLELDFRIEAGRLERRTP